MTDGPGAVPPPGEHTARAVAVLSFSGRTLGDLPGLVGTLATVKLAAVRANATAGVLDADVAAAIAGAATVVAEDATVGGPLLARFPVDPLGGGGAIGVHMNVNEVLGSLAAELVGAEAVGDVRRTVGASQSTADVCHTAGRLAALDAVDALGDAVDATVAELAAVADRFGDVPTLSRTCLQDGQAVPARFLVDGWADALRRRRERLMQAAEPLHQVVLGGTVIGDGAGASDAYRAAVVPELAAAAGRPLTAAPDAPSRLQHGDDLVDVAEAVASLARAAAKIARDLRFLGSGPAGGVGELRLPHVLDGSSFFAGKRNPVVPETVIQAAIAADGHAAAARAAADQAELHLNVFDLTAAVAVLDAAGGLARALDLLTEHTLHGLELDVDRCRALAELAAPTKETS